MNLQGRAWRLESGHTCRETEPSLCSSRYDWAIVAKAMFHFSPVGKGNKQSSRFTFTLSRVPTGCFAVHSYTGQSTHKVILPSIQNMIQKLVYRKGIYRTAANSISYSFKGIQQRKKFYDDEKIEPKKRARLKESSKEKPKFMKYETKQYICIKDFTLYMRKLNNESQCI